MLTHNLHIVNYLDSYIENENSKFAVMIDGEWGTGKSYFIEKYCETKKSTGSQIYNVSAFGLRKISELENLILDSISGESGMFKKALKKLWGNTRLDVDLGPLTTGFSGEDIKEIYQKDFEKIIKQNKNCLVIIDDFERSDINFSEMLGFCSRLIFENGMKVILICNESKLKNENEKNTIYFEFKEKVIGKKFSIYSDANTAFKVFTKEFENKSKIIGQGRKSLVFNALNLINKRIIDTITEQDTNLRIYQYALSDLIFFIEEIYNDLNIDDEFVTNNKEYFEKIIYMKMVTYLRNNNFFYVTNPIDSKKIHLDAEQFLKDFYKSRGMDNSTPLMEEWISINSKGDFSKYSKLIKIEIENRRSKSNVENSPMNLIKKFLDNLYDLPKNGITNIIDIKNKIMEGELYDIGEIYHYLCIVEFLNKKGVSDLYLLEEFKEIAEKNKRFEMKEKFYSNTEGYMGYSFLSPDKHSRELVKIKKELMVMNSKDNQKNMEAKLKECSSIKELNKVINELKKKEIDYELDLSLIFDEENKKFSPKKIVSDMISIDYREGDIFIKELKNNKKNIKTTNLLQDIQEELLEQKEKHPTSYNVIKIDRLIEEIGIIDYM